MHKLSDIWSFIGERQGDIKDLKKEIGGYRERYEKDTRALHGLADSKTLEKYAREKYFMHRENEDLFVIVE